MTKQCKGSNAGYRIFVSEVTNYFMKRVYGLVVIVFLFCTGYAQVIVPNDSAITGPGYNQLIFYSLATGTKTSASNTDWQLAVTVRPTQFPQSPLGGTTIRHNEANGVSVFIAPNANAASFNSLDTTNWRSWRKLHDSDTLLDMGAFNSIRGGNIFDFGWGFYNSTTHNVVGDSIFLIELPNGDLKKFLVVGLVYDTAFNLQYSNVDNSNLQNIHIGKAEYAGKEFVYLNLANNTINDKEPLATDWDLEFLEYFATGGSPGIYLPKAGAWVNPGTMVAKATGVDVQSNNYQGLTFSPNLNTIGWDWEINDSLQIYHVQDSLAYFVETKAGNYYKIVFTGFGGSTTGVFSFYSQAVAAPSAISETRASNIETIFPNPTNSTLNILLNTRSSSYLKVFDITGKVITEKEISETLTQLNIASFASGIYLLAVTTGDNTSFTRFTVAR